MGLVTELGIAAIRMAEIRGKYLSLLPLPPGFPGSITFRFEMLDAKFHQVAGEVAALKRLTSKSFPGLEAKKSELMDRIMTGLRWIYQTGEQLEADLDDLIKRSSYQLNKKYDCGSQAFLGAPPTPGSSNSVGSSSSDQSGRNGNESTNGSTVVGSFGGFSAVLTPPVNGPLGSPWASSTLKPGRDGSSCEEFSTTGLIDAGSSPSSTSISPASSSSGGSRQICVRCLAQNSPQTRCIMIAHSTSVLGTPNTLGAYRCEFCGCLLNDHFQYSSDVSSSSPASSLSSMSNFHT